MEAVIATGGKQYRVAPGQVIKVERLAKDKGASVEFTEVLLVNDAGQVTVEPKALASAKVLGQVVAERKENKVLVVKFKRPTNVFVTTTATVPARSIPCSTPSPFPGVSCVSETLQFFLATRSLRVRVR